MKKIIFISIFFIIKSSLIAQFCDLSIYPISSTENYDMNGSFSDYFINSDGWPSFEGEITQENELGKLSTNSNTNNAEAWELYKTKMPYNQSWEFSAQVTVPLYWNSAPGNEPQVGIGLFAGKPAEGNNPAATVYECNMATISNEVRFVQAQLIPNRLGGEPENVQFSMVDNNLESANLKIQYCHENHSLGLLIDGSPVGTNQAIDETGLFDWNLTDNDFIEIGIMGFAENTFIATNHPTIDDININIHDNTVVSVESIESTKFRISPNPANNHIIIKQGKHSPIHSIKIYDIFGKLLLQKSVSNINSFNLSLNNISNGVLIININDSFFTKIIKD